MFLQYLLFGLVTGNFYATASPQRNNQEYCYNTDRIPSQLLYLGTKTPYQLAKGSQNDAHYVLPSTYDFLFFCSCFCFTIQILSQ